MPCRTSVSSASTVSSTGVVAIPLVRLVEVDVVDPETPQARLAGADEVVAREALVVRAVAHAEAGLRRDEQAVAAALDRRPDDLLGDAARVDVGGVDQVDAGVEAAVDDAAGPVAVGRADLLEAPCRRTSSCRA